MKRRISACIIGLGIILGFCIVRTPSQALETTCRLDDSFTPQLARIRVALAKKHVAWESVRRGISATVITDALATGMSPHRIIAGLQFLLDRGQTLHDARIVVGVAAETARARNVDPTTVLKAIYAALDGEDAALIELDPKLRPILQRRGDLSVVLRQMKTDFSPGLHAENNAALNYDRSKVLRELQCPDVP